MQKNQDGKPTIVREPVMRPNHCALNQFIFQDPEGFIDTGVKLAGFEPRVYVAMSSARDLARTIGFISPEEQETARDTITELEGLNAEQAERIVELEREAEAVATLKRAGYTTARKPGPKVAA